MVLFDTLDGVFVGYAYGWALSGDARKVRYNVIVTAVSAIAALLIAAVEIIGAISEALGWRGPVSTTLASVDLNVAGIVLVAALSVLFLVVHVLRRTGRGVRGLQSIDASPADQT
jgi:high-affinity nickel-transport protein